MSAAYHHENLRETLLELAERSVQRSGVEALSLRQLARDANVSHAAPARHFRDRRALLDALALDGFQRLNRAMADAAATPGTFDARFRAIASAYVTFAVDNAALLGLMYTVKHEADASDALVEAGRGSLRAAVELIAEAQAAGAVTAGDDPERLALVAFASVHGVAALATGDLLDGVSVAEATDATVDLLLRAIGVTQTARD
ncbi:TetR/AcrR family transcriptional regulator [Agromyces sp. Soil535]|uniref:TetR/AcrR family transcriptional regulator n=1 Tax=Agromyces sp. Soil535 TaxID=1736390 RepID=UPI0006F64B8B|nr:TetR/AcrR family transcriptional regulator [Agromyces sp. Soil535]KRE28874.1 transcriptional regulator [Agromyces sp. Soil535]